MHFKCFFQVPVGSLFRNNDGMVISDLDKEGSIFVASHGGAGGRGNHYFLSNENRHPNIAEMGGTGENKSYAIELKTMAHAGLVGNVNSHIRIYVLQYGCNRTTDSIA